MLFICWLHLTTHPWQNYTIILKVVVLLRNIFIFSAKRMFFSREKPPRVITFYYRKTQVVKGLNIRYEYVGRSISIILLPQGVAPG
jgi:hypothetical protein